MFDVTELMVWLRLAYEAAVQAMVAGERMPQRRNVVGEAPLLVRFELAGPVHRRKVRIRLEASGQTYDLGMADDIRITAALNVLHASSGNLSRGDRELLQILGTVKIEDAPRLGLERRAAELFLATVRTQLETAEERARASQSS